MEKLLQELGLTKNQVRVYLAFLKSGETMTTIISKNLQMDKSSTYRAVEELVKKNLLTPNLKTRGTTYSATNPEVLKELLASKKIELESQANSLDKFIDQLNKSLLIQRTTNIKVEKGIKAHLICMENSLKNNKEKLIRESWDMNNIIFQDKEYSIFVNDFAQRRIRLHIFDKYLTKNLLQNKVSDLMHTSTQLLKEVRILPDNFTSSHGYRIYGDTIEIVSFDENKDYIVVTIQDRYITELMKNMFDFIWDHSEVFTK